MDLRVVDDAICVTFSTDNHVVCCYAETPFNLLRLEKAPKPRGFFYAAPHLTLGLGIHFANLFITEPKNPSVFNLLR
jgi:hypothetical protein